MFVLEYIQKFDELSRYAQHMVTTEDLKKDHLMKGLRKDLAKDLKVAGVRDASFNELIDRALVIEQAYEENKEEKRKNKGSMDQRNFQANHEGQHSNNNKRKGMPAVQDHSHYHSSGITTPRTCKTQWYQSQMNFCQRPLPKEYIQSSRLDQCALQASQSEQYVTVDIPTDLVTNWKREGYTHLHLGGVRLILALHGRKGLPVTARIALLDTRFKQYQHAVIGTVLTTLHAGKGYLVYPDKVNRHFLWDVPAAHMCNPDCPCLDDTDDDEDFEVMRRRRRRKKKPSIPKTSCRPYFSGPPDDPDSYQPLPIYNKALRHIQRESSFQPVPIQPQIKSCLMFSSSIQSYQESFSPLERHTDPQTKVVSQPYVQSPITTSGAPEAPKQYEPFYTPSKQSTYDQFFGLSHLHSTNPNIPSAPPKEDLQVPEDSPKVTPEPPKKDKAPAYQYHYQQINFHDNDSDSTSEESLPSTDTPSSSDHTSSDLESHYADISGLLMATKTEDPSTSTPVVEESSDDNNDDQGSQTEPAPPIPPVSENSSKLSSSPWFTFDDIPCHKWQARHQEFAVWIDVQMTRSHAQSHNILREFCSRKKKHSRCFICKKRHHFARTCPNKSAKSVHLIQHLQQSSIISDNEDVESIFSEQSEKDDHTTFILADLTDSDPDDIFVISTIQEINHIRPKLPGPSVKISVIPFKFHKPVSVIGFLDTGAQRSMLNSRILPSDYWEHHTEYFRAVNGKIFKTSLISKKPIGIQFFSNCIIWQKIVGSELPDKDLLLGFNILQLTYGIMLLEKKSNIRKESVEFLGIVLKDGHYYPGPHIAAELLKFPDIDLNKKQIQQFLGIVNYVRDFIPKVAIHTSQLSCMLKRHTPPWGQAQTEAVKHLKKIAQSPPPLRISTTGQHILHIDASDNFWSTILLEKIGDSESYCAHASGQFKDSEKNYHVIYKEVLAVKYGIKKFEFHLVSHNFLIRIDNSYFPKIFDFKNKLLLDKQLLNLETWFAKYDLSVQHIKDDKNLIPNFLTRPSIKSSVIISSIQTIPIIAMYRSLPFKALTQKAFPLNLTFRSAFQIQAFAKKFLYRYFMNVHRTKPERFPSLCLEHLFLTGFTIVPSLTISADELRYVLQDPAPVLMEFLFVNNDLTTPMFSSKTPKTLGKTFNLYCQHKKLSTLITEPGSSSTPTPAQKPQIPELDEDYLIYQEIQKVKDDYENKIGDVSPSRFPSTP
ncbi:hypothetical protein KPL71_012037 [Citrus sinensis]|uniref:Uncharacterized protein n=1 Tax=Citrus sinensis TaxID=2711 RepID=A0ACB8L7Y0_CITSI|nr:hypothetical protein KPL71_012037 [Citrus sinensis]